MKKALLFFVVLFFGLQLASAQNLSVSGKVTYADDGTPIIGATIMVKGVNSSATITDVNGAYKLSVPASAPEKVIVASFIGMVTQEQPVSVNGQVVNFAMEADAQRIESVVVTGQGLTRSQRSVGFSTAVVNSDELTAAQSPSLMQGVQGKVAGINISQSGGAGTSQKVIVRGYSSISGGNQPLYIVDGMPIDNNMFGNTTISNSVDFGNQANDINPNDVESMTILKGASATALYGSRAANGVIIITTKKASGSKFSVVYDGNFMGSDVLRTPQTQNVFGQGWQQWQSTENGSWGPRFDGRKHAWGPYAPYPADKVYGTMPEGFQVQSKPFSFVENNIRDFYQMGFEMNNNLAISMSGKDMGLVLSYGNASSTGVLPMNSDRFERNTLSLRGNIKRGIFSADAQVNYVRKDINQVPGGQGAGVFKELLQYASDISFSDQKDYNNSYNNFGNYYTWWANNPYQVVADNGSKYQDDRVYGKVELGLDITKNIKAIGRLAADFTNATRKDWTAKKSTSPEDWGYLQKADTPGSYLERYDHIGQLDATVLVTADYKVADDRVGLGGFLGWNMNQRSVNRTTSTLEGLDTPGWYSLSNGSAAPLTTTYESRRRLIGLMGQFDFSLDNAWFVSLSARNDWSSTLPIDANSFFYWGVNTSFILNEYVDMGDKINMFKIRASYGQTGNDAGVYLTSDSFVPAKFSVFNGSLNTPLNGVPGLTVANTMGNDQLRPEITTEWEIGIGLNAFDNRLRFDAGYYDKVTKDQIISGALPAETGYTLRTMNVGTISNKGIEIALGGTIIQTGDWKWDVNVTFAKNWSMVEELWGDQETMDITPYGAPIKMMIVKGQPVASFYYNKLKTVEGGEHDGKYIVDGLGKLQNDPDNFEVIGTTAADFTMGFNTSLSWKNIALSATFDWRAGGSFISNTKSTLDFSGNSESTAFNDRQPFVQQNAVREAGKGPDGKMTYVENDIPYYGVNSGLYYANTYYYSNQNAAMNREEMLDKDFIKLRELVLTYNFPSKIFGAQKVVKGLALSLIGRNLFMWTPGNNKFVDPEISGFGNDISSEYGEFCSAPSVRSFGGSVKLTF